MARTKYKLRLWLIGTLVIALISAYFAFQRHSVPYRHPTVDAAEYIPPAGCGMKRYTSADTISNNCATEQYIFADWKEYGLEWPGPPGTDHGHQTGTYYRVGADLVGFQCNFGHCIVHGIERDVFTIKK